MGCSRKAPEPIPLTPELLIPGDGVSESANERANDTANVPAQAEERKRLGLIGFVGEFSNH